MAETRWLDREAVAQYIHVRVDELSRMQRKGLLPEPSYRLGPRSPRWDKLELDSWFGKSTTSTPDISQTVANFVANIKQTPRARRAQETRGRLSQTIPLR